VKNRAGKMELTEYPGWSSGTASFIGSFFLLVEFVLLLGAASFGAVDMVIKT